MDDEAGVRELLSESLQQRGYETQEAVDGKDALERAAAFLPDLILLDVVMPKMDGWGVLSRLRMQEATRDIPVVMLTAKSDTGALLRSEEQKAVDYFIKPIKMEELLTFIERYIG